MHKHHKISLCTICMNRLHHLKETLPRNIQDNLDYPNLEHVILDYNSQDGMEKWVRQHLEEHIRSGRVRYYKTPDPQKFNMPHSKNMVSKLATGDIVCLVDADNYTGSNYALYVNLHFNKEPDTFLTTIGKYKVHNKVDVLGRICFWKKDFLHIQGFDEFMVSYGFDDYDFANRLALSGRNRMLITSGKFLHAITHSLDERIQHQQVSKDFKKLFVRHINCSESELLYLFADNSFSLGTMQDNHAKAALSINALFEKKPYQYSESLGSEDWIRGTWQLTPEHLVLKYDNTTILLTNKNDNITSADTGNTYRQIKNAGTITDLLLFHTVIRNRNKMNRNLRQKKMIVNGDTYGSGKVYFNFSNHSFTNI